MPGGSNDATWAMEVYICMPCWDDLSNTMGSELRNFSDTHSDAVELDINNKMCWHCRLSIGRVEWNNSIGRWVRK